MLILFFFSFLFFVAKSVTSKHQGAGYEIYEVSVECFLLCGADMGHRHDDRNIFWMSGTAIARVSPLEVVPMFEFTKSTHSNKMIAPGDSKFNNWHKR